MRAALTASALALLLGSSALAGPKPPASAVFEPEIGYTYGSGNYTDLRLANRAGDKAILVHRTAFGALGSFDLSDEASQRIAYQDGGRLYVRSWQTQNGAVSIGAPSLIFDAPGRAEIMDFEPSSPLRNGSKLAFSVIATPEVPNYGAIRIYDLNSPATPSVVVLEGWQVFDVRWHPDGASLYFLGRQFVDGDFMMLRRLHLATGTIDNLSLVGASASFDLTRPKDPGQVLIAWDSASQIDLFDENAGYVRPFAAGSLAHFSCRNDAAIHRAFATRRPPTRITYLNGGFETWSTDSNIHHTDWMPRVPCL